MKIQYIGLGKLSKEDSESNLDILESQLRYPRDLDDFDINFIDLNYSKLWEKLPNVEYNIISSQHQNDFQTLKNMIKQTESKVFIALPQNQIHPHLIKDYLQVFDRAFSLISPYTIKILYANTISKINEIEAESDFVFNMVGSDIKTITSSIKGKKQTTIQIDNLYYTTLDIRNYSYLLNLLNVAELISFDNEDIPSWMEEIKMFDDEIQSEKIISSENRIAEIQTEIKTAQDKLDNNLRLKSILYTQSDELVNVVFQIFEEMLQVDLSKFEDKKKEDIAFEIENKFFIGEIKGITSNVKSPNLSQLDLHFTKFLEKNPEIREEDVYKLLIINHQRKRPVNDRDPVDNKQIELARKKYGSLIIETVELLKMFEKYLEGNLSKESILEKLTQVGILK